MCCDKTSSRIASNGSEFLSLMSTVPYTMVVDTAATHNPVHLHRLPGLAVAAADMASKCKTTRDAVKRLTATLQAMKGVYKRWGTSLASWWEQQGQVERLVFLKV